MLTYLDGLNKGHLKLFCGHLPLLWKIFWSLHGKPVSEKKERRHKLVNDEFPCTRLVKEPVSQRRGGRTFLARAEAAGGSLSPLLLRFLSICLLPRRPVVRVMEVGVCWKAE